MAACALFNVTIERFAYRRLRNAPKLAPLITAVGVSFILQNIGILMNGSAPHSRSQRAAAVLAAHRIDPDPRQVHHRDRHHHSAAAADDVDRAEDESRQGNARHRSRP